LIGLRLVYVPAIANSGLDMTIIALGTCMVITAAAQSRWQAPRLLSPLLALAVTTRADQHSRAKLTDMEVTLHIPDDIAKRLSAAGGDVSCRVMLCARF
jgi:hypothetical protein